ncbi:MAG: TRAP transporter large permease subunit [Proteobacteria bacterium]|nr:TRAP transporter large permease subunit [Pseudomonadota bacterium]
MEQIAIGLALLAVMFALLASGVWVAISLLGVGMVGMMLFTPAPTGMALATTVWGASDNWALTALPLFIWMAEILFRTRLAEDMFTGLAPWLTRLPGRLLHVNILGCGIFAAVSGSSSATCATIGKMSMPELMRRGYDEKMAICTLAGSGTLGLLIPPSIMLIVYGFVAEVSIARLFIAGFLPGIMLIIMFMSYTVMWALMNPDKTPPSDIEIGFAEKLYASRRLIPVMCLIVGVLGSIYTGVATPTEAAAIGVAGALLLSWAFGSLTWGNFASAVMGATRTSCMIILIINGAAFLSITMGFTGIPRTLAGWIVSMDLSVYTLLFVLTIVYLVLGCFLDGTSIVVLTTGIIQPMIQAAGIDVVWYGIYIVVVVEVAQITPPVGFNLFVLQHFTGRNILYVAQASLPFFFVLLAAIPILVAFPQIALWLPTTMLSR